MSLQPGTSLGPYQIDAPLRAGGMGEVYKASDTRLDRTVAIKVLPTIDGAWRTICLMPIADEYVLTGARAEYFAPAPPPIRPSIEFTVTDTRGQYVAVALSG